MDFLYSLLGNSLISFLIGPIFLYVLISVIVYFATPIQERRLALADEVELDSLRTWGMMVKQNATLTNMKLYQNGVFMFGKKQRAVVVPLDSIDSIQIASGRNYLWLALSLSIVLSVLYGSTRMSYSYGGNSTVVTIALVLAALLFGLFWLSGSRRIIVRSKTASIVVDATTINSSVTGQPVTEARLYGFANRIQSLVMQAHQSHTPTVPDDPQPKQVPSDTSCPSCNAQLVPGSRFCESCGIPIGS